MELGEVNLVWFTEDKFLDILIVGEIGVRYFMFDL